MPHLSKIVATLGITISVVSFGLFEDDTSTATAASVIETNATAPSVRGTAVSAVASSTTTTAKGPGRRHRDARAGVSVADADGATRGLRRSGASWTYDWATTPSFDLPAEVAFVPMVWSDAAATPQQLAAATKYGPDLLGFNEPDHPGQANMTVEKALATWPLLTATGMRLGSPAVAYGAADPGGWLDRFMTGARLEHQRVDFIALHWYGEGSTTDESVKQLRAYLVAVHHRYHRPVWLTEFALARWTGMDLRFATPDRQAAFLTAAARMMSALPWLERYAWFTLHGSADIRSTNLFGSAGATTVTGRAFKRVVG